MFGASVPDLAVVQERRAPANLPPGLVCWWAGEPDGAVLHVAGELDIATTPAFEHTLHQAQAQAQLVVVDLRELTFIDSCGVRAILGASLRAHQNGRRLVVVRGPRSVDHVFTLTRIGEYLEVGDLDPAEPAIQVLLQLARRDRAHERDGDSGDDCGSIDGDRQSQPARAQNPAAGRRRPARTHRDARTPEPGQASPTGEATADQEARAPDAVAIRHETSERLVRVIVFGAPPAGLVVAGWLAWGGTLHWQDLVVLAITYTLTGLGITVGYHRLFTHRSFKTTRPMRALLAVLGSMAVEGPVIEWVATHRKHHRFSDKHGDPHSPHVGQTPGWLGGLRGLGHAHMGWMFRGKDMANPACYARDLLADRDLRFISRTFPLWVVAGLALPFGLGAALTGSIVGGLTGLLWGGAVRVFLLHHATFSINSLCHYYGRRPFATADQSRNLAWLAPLAFGEAWHNNHHAFPTSARHGLGRRQIDPGAWLISGLERVHLAWDVVRISSTRQAAKRGGARRLNCA